MENPDWTAALRRTSKSALCGAFSYAGALGTAVFGMYLVPDTNSIASLFLGLVAMAVGACLLGFTFLCLGAVTLRAARVQPVPPILTLGVFLSAIYTYSGMGVLGLSLEEGLILALIASAGAFATSALFTDLRPTSLPRRLIGAAAALTLPVGMAANHLRDVGAERLWTTSAFF